MQTWLLVVASTDIFQAALGSDVEFVLLASDGLWDYMNRLAIPLGSLLKESAVVLIDFHCLLKSREDNHLAFLLLFSAHMQTLNIFAIAFSAQMQLLLLEINFDSMETFRSISHLLLIYRSHKVVIT